LEPQRGRPPRTAIGVGSESKIHLLFETVNFGDLHFDFVAQADYAPRASANQVVSLGIKNIKVVRHGGKRYEAAHGQAGDIDEETEVARPIRNARIRPEAARPPGLMLHRQRLS
jgi:hypothetical protein